MLSLVLRPTVVPPCLNKGNLSPLRSSHLLFCLGPNYTLRLWPHGLQLTRLPCPSSSRRVCSNSKSLSWWFHPTVSSSASLFFSWPWSFPSSGSFPVSLLFISDGQNIGASASVLPYIQFISKSCWLYLQFIFQVDHCLLLLLVWHHHLSSGFLW